MVTILLYQYDYTYLLYYIIIYQVLHIVCFCTLRSVTKAHGIPWQQSLIAAY